MTTLIKTILAIALSIFALQIQAQEIDGSYKGVLKTQGMELELIFNFRTSEDKLTATMDVPLQGASGIEMDSATQIDNRISITSAKLKMEYIGTLINNKITGTYTQLGTDYPLDLMKTEKIIPGNPELPTSDAVLAALAAKETGDFKYTVEDYFKKPAASGFTLSPDGTYISYMKRRENGKQDLYLKNTETQEETLAVAQDEDVIRGHFWASEDRLLYAQDTKGDENYHVYGVDLDGSNKKDLTPYEGVRVGILAILKEDPEHIIIQMNKDNLKQNEPYKLNIATGTLEKLYTVVEGNPPVAGFDFDKDGNLRAISRVVNGIDTEILYNVDGDFKRLKLVPFGDGFGILRFDYSSAYEHDAYVVSNLDSDKMQIQRFDLKENKVIETVYEDDTYDVSGISLSRKRNYEIDYFSHVAEKSVVVPVSSTYKKLHKRLKKEFGDKEFFTVGRTDAEDKFMIMVTSDRIVGEYHLYDVKKDEVTLLYKLLPHLKEDDMAAMQPITFKSRDGKTIHGYLTMPQEVKKGEKVPMIVNPHGGPQGLRDTWSFNQEAQLFASRGYATLHVNFRISGGYGKEFMNSGYGQIGRKVMDDLEDGIDYVIAQGRIDKDRVAIFGGSHGGYAVLRGMMKTPEKYACGVDYVGVSNLNTFMTTFPPYWENYRAIVEKIWYNPAIPEEQEIMNEISPALHTDKIVKPLFVVQGANDPRVNIDEADQIVEQLTR